MFELTSSILPKKPLLEPIISSATTQRVNRYKKIKLMVEIYEGLTKVAVFNVLPFLSI